ncbi:tail length tape measure protein [Shigella sonnei]|nr:tail length tape measure protein [Shigella sonnei]
MTEAHKQLLALQQRISDLDGKKLTADEKSVLTRKNELIQALTLLDVKQQELQKQTALNDLRKKTVQLTSQLADKERALREQHNLDIATAGMGDKQRQRYQAQLRIRQEYRQQLQQLENDSRQKGTYGTEDYRRAEEVLKGSLKRQLNENKRYWQELEVAQGDWKNGSDAARIAMSALAEETGKRTSDIDNNLNALGSTLQTLSDWWKQFWDAAMNIGREDSLDAQIDALQEKIQRAKKYPWTNASTQVEYDQQRLNDLQEKKRRKDLQDAKAQAERNYQEQQKRRNAENAALNRMNETEAARHQREIARINAMQYADQAVRDAAIQRENERYEKAIKKNTRATRNDEATRLLLQYSQQQAQVEGQIAAARQSAGIAIERMTEAHKQLLALQQRISDLDGKKLTADEKSVLTRKNELIQALTLLDVKQQELQKQTALNDLRKKTVQLTSQLADKERALREQHNLDIATAGMGDKQRQRYQAQLRIRQEYRQQLQQLENDSRQKGTYGTEDYRRAEEVLKGSLKRQLNENKRYWQELEVAQGDWKNGAMRAFQNFTADADNAAGTAEQMFTVAFSSAGNALATFCTTGKLNFKSFTSSLLSDMARIMAQMAMMQAVKGVGSLFGFTTNADGGVYQSADLSRYSGTVVNRPTFFAFAKGAGVMGEAGPEAILPLRRGADGKLGGVADTGGSGMVMFAPQYNIEINNDGTNGQIGPAALKVVYDLGKKAAADFMQQQARDGGRLSGAYR